MCTVCENGDLRLQGGQSHEGFVQYCWNGVWSTVCVKWIQADGQGYIEATVACRQLGYHGKLFDIGIPTKTLMLL